MSETKKTEATTTEDVSLTRLINIFSTDAYGVSRIERKLMTRPFARLHLAWVGLGYSALSPLSFCAISGLAPGEMWEALKKERGFAIGLCYTTKLPVIYWDSAYSNQHIENMYDEDWEAEYYDRDPADYRIGRGCPCTDCVNKPIPERKVKQRDKIPPRWKGFVEEYLGENWKEHATREFDPFKTGCAISKTEWDQLLNAYYLKLHKDGVPVSEEENATYIEKQMKKIKKIEEERKSNQNLWYYR